jgi:hypothetical protein
MANLAAVRSTLDALGTGGQAFGQLSASKSAPNRPPWQIGSATQEARVIQTDTHPWVGLGGRAWLSRWLRSLSAPPALAPAGTEKGVVELALQARHVAGACGMWSVGYL